MALFFARQKRTVTQSLSGRRGSIITEHAQSISDIGVLFTESAEFRFVLVEFDVQYGHRPARRSAERQAEVPKKVKLA